MKRMTSQQLEAASTKDLVAYYNHFAGKSIIKFSSRAAGLKQCSAYAVDEGDGHYGRDDRYSCPHCGGNANITNAGPEGTVAGDERGFCHECGTEFWLATGKIYNAPAASASRSASIAASWADPEVRTERSVRTRVLVDGVEYRSVAQAFAKLGLSMGAHIRFRMDLKAAGKLTYLGHKFVAITKE